MKPKVIIMCGYGINSEVETEYVFEQVGAEAECVHINDLIDGHKKLADYQIMVFPGGFYYGDDTGSGNAYANKCRWNLWDDILKFISDEKLVCGICNGFQIISNLGLVAGFDEKYGKRDVALLHNAAARLECRWVNLKAESKKCVWTRDVDILRMPTAHGEGKFFVEDDVLKKLEEGDQIAFRYVKDDGSPANGEIPVNPNGSLADIAGVCDPTGRVFGLMPHPERAWNFYNMDHWAAIREKAEREGIAVPEETPNMKMFRNAVEYFG